MISRLIQPILFLFFVLLLSGCSSGPTVMKGNRLDYNISVQKSNTEELLINLVRARYAESLFFLQVGSISSSFDYTVNGSVAAHIFVDPADNGGNLIESSLGGQFSERPTITYTPVQGEQAAKQLMEEISLERLMLLSRASWDIQTLMWAMVHRLGPLHNFEPELSVGTGEPYRHFLAFTNLISEIQRRGDLDFAGITKAGEGILKIRLIDEQEQEKIQVLLGLQPESTIKQNDRIIATLILSPVMTAAEQITSDSGITVLPIKMKSCFQVIYDLAWSVAIPAEDEKKQLYLKAAPVDDGLNQVDGPHAGLVRVSYSRTRPEESFVAVPYRQGWYYISDDDVRSKAFLMLVRTLFSLQAGGIHSPLPLLTIPVNG